MSCGHRFNAASNGKVPTYSGYGTNNNSSSRAKAGGDTLLEGQQSVQSSKQKSELARTQKQNAIKIDGAQRSQSVRSEGKDSAKETLEDKSPLDVDESADASTLPVIFIILLTIAILAALFIFGVFDKDEVIELYTTKNEVISIPKGKVQDGLSGEARALFILGCERSKKDGQSCEESVFLVGETTENKLEVPAFRMDKYEVANIEFQECVEAGRCKISEKCAIYTHEGKQFGSRPPKILLTPSHPVVCVSHQTAAGYCAFKGGALPTKGEFLRAARGKDRRVFAWGNHWDPEFGNWAERDIVGTPVLGKIDGYGFTSPQGAFDKGCSPFSVCGLSGNVGEWAKKEGAKSYYRSGGWTDSPFDLRVTREREGKKARTDVGFRCVYK